MKKVYLLLFAMGMFTFTACNMGAQEGEETSTEAEEVTTEEVVSETPEVLAEHVCNDKCTDDGCNFLHGEKGHECSAECTEHPHAE